MNLADQVLLVTNVAGSLASRIAHEASARGARVVLATNDTPAEAIAEGWTSLTSRLDSEAEIDRLYDVVLERLARLDAVVVVVESPAIHPVHALDLESWHRLITMPLRTAFWLAQRAVDEFVGSGSGGRIVFVVGHPDTATTGASTSVIPEALASLARCVAREYGRRAVACNVVVQCASADPEHPLGDQHRPVVECVLVLASPTASFVTGESVSVGNPVPSSRHWAPRQ